MEDSVAFAVDSADQLKSLFAKTKVALSKLYSMVFPRLPQEKNLEELTGAFFIDHENPIEVLKRNSCILGATLAFQLLMGYDVESEFEVLSKSMPTDEEGEIVDLTPFRDTAKTCVFQLIDLVDSEKAENKKKSAPAASVHSSMP